MFDRQTVFEHFELIAVHIVVLHKGKKIGFIRENLVKLEEIQRILPEDSNFFFLFKRLGVQEGVLVEHLIQLFQKGR